MAKTKYVIIVPDGAADYPLDIFDGKSVIEAAHTPNMDEITVNGKKLIGNAQARKKTGI